MVHQQKECNSWYCKINSTLIKYAADRNLEKDGLKTLGSNISIISEKIKSYETRLLFSFLHFKKEFIKREKKFMRYGVNSSFLYLK